MEENKFEYYANYGQWAKTFEEYKTYGRFAPYADRNEYYIRQSFIELFDPDDRLLYNFDCSEEDNKQRHKAMLNEYAEFIISTVEEKIQDDYRILPIKNSENLFSIEHIFYFAKEREFCCYMSGFTMILIFEKTSDKSNYKDLCKRVFDSFAETHYPQFCIFANKNKESYVQRSINTNISSLKEYKKQFLDDNTINSVGGIDNTISIRLIFEVCPMVSDIKDTDKLCYIPDID